METTNNNSNNKDQNEVLEQFIQSVNPVTQTKLEDKFPIARDSEIDIAVKSAFNAWKIYKNISGTQKALFLRKIASEIEELGDILVQQAMAESGLPEGRIKGERGRTCNQLRQFADHVEEGSWVDAIVDEALPDRKPMPRVDLRKMSKSIGPVAIFTASNFPLAFSTAGGDTSSALASGCPVIVKAHPSHLGTNRLVSNAISKAAEKCDLPKGVFSTVEGDIETGCLLVKHPLVKAVGFTGSFTGGKALFDLANNRPEPIPVYSEMGSNNPIFILDEKIKNESKDLAASIANSINMGAGQFCTNPGILVIQKSNETDGFLADLKMSFQNLGAHTMLNEGIYKSYNTGKAACINTAGVNALYEGESTNEWKGVPSIATVHASDFMKNSNLTKEVFGPFTLVVVCETEAEVIEIAENLEGQLTATIMGTPDELDRSTDLLEILSQKAGRVIFNGVPTGVEVCEAMHHGGPFPSTSNAMFTSVGRDAIKRFVRPVTYQNMPDSLLPKELQKDNPLKIWRTINGIKTKE